MRVVSQNRDFSFNFDNTVFWKQYNIIYARIGKENIPIGQYESDERAAEVFKEIHKRSVFSIESGMNNSAVCF